MTALPFLLAAGLAAGPNCRPDGPPKSSWGKHATGRRRRHRDLPERRIIVGEVARYAERGENVCRKPEDRTWSQYSDEG